MRNFYDQEKKAEESIPIIGFIFITPEFNEASENAFKDLYNNILKSKELSSVHKCHLIWHKHEDKSKLVSSQLLDVLDMESQAIIDPVHEYTKYTIKSFLNFINTGFVSSFEEKQTQNYAELWKRISEKFQKTTSINLSPPKRQTYFQFPINFVGVHLEWWLHQRSNYFGVELHFERKQKEENVWLFNKFQDLIKAKLNNNSEFVYERDWAEKWSRIYLLTENTEISENLVDFAVNKMTFLYDIIKDDIETIKQEFEVQLKKKVNI